MTTNTRTMLVIVLIAVVAMMLSACQPAKLVASAYSGDAPATGINVNISPRLDGCDMSSNQLILNEANAQSDEEASKTTVNAFLDARMSKYSCIAAK